MTAVNSTTEFIAALALIDLPFESPNHKYEAHGGRGVQITASSNLVLFKKEIKEAQADLDTNLLVIHRFFELNNKQSEKKIKEFLTNQVYGCEVITTNVSQRSQKYQILWQIPEGSLPLQKTNYQKSENKELNPYTTSTFDFYFYFPEPGVFRQFPSNITINGKVVAKANECTLKVVKEIEEVSFETFRDILASGDKATILKFVKEANLIAGDKGFNFSDMYWLMQDKEMFKQVTDILRSRRIYDGLLWNYAITHKDEKTLHEILQKHTDVQRILGTFFESGLVKCSERSSGFRHLDYFPLVNSRAHKLGDEQQAGILNQQFKNTYNVFLKTMLEKDRLNNADWLCYTFYLLLQDRIQEAIKIYEQVDPSEFKKNPTLQIQYDYMTAYLDFYTGSEHGFQKA